ncbi:DUF2358-containing protein [Aureococcus anophagefferens]|nr:DUF2358-containing protein [Aureococcus anophagefferens]
MARLLALAVVAAAYGPTKPYQRAVPSVARRTTPSRPAPLAPLSAYNSTSVPEEFNLNEVMEREREEAPVELPGAGDDFVELPKLGAAPGDGRKSPSEFELNLGEAIDALKADVPDFPDREPNYAVYTADVQLADPTGVQTRGLTSYKQFFAMIRLFRRVMIDRAEVTYRLRYDWSGKRIIVTWYSSWTARGSRTPAHVDAVSYFHLNEEGRIFKHEVDRVQINGQMMNPPYSCCDFVLFKMCCNGGVGIPAFQPALAPIPIPVEREPYPNQPPPPGSRW